jgi:hypothetical protein
MPIEAHASALVLLIPIVAIVLGIGIGFWAIYWDHRAKQMKFKERELMIEKGLTPSSFEPKKGPATLEDYLRRGIVMAFLGIGLGIGYVILRNSVEPPAWLCGVGAAIVGFLGVGNLVYYAIVKKQKNETSENNSRISIP